ncbi:MAG: sigma-70 family RNA polymerase sigma factor [Saprospiraceae bacterium]|nr:sigma-70 family RNA polymerase sigma factor [Saprospiraceae bacterium]
MTDSGDIFLWRRLKTGDKKALEQIYSTHVDALIQYGRRFCSNEQLVEDAIQDLFIYVWSNKEKLGDTDSIIRYLLISLKRALFKKMKEAGKIADAEPEHHSFEASLSMEDMIIEEEGFEEQSTKLKQAFEALSAKQKEAIYLRFYQKLDYEAICEIMEINYQSVRNLISRALSRMRGHMNVLFWWILLLGEIFAKILSTKGGIDPY